MKTSNSHHPLAHFFAAATLCLTAAAPSLAQTDVGTAAYGVAGTTGLGVGLAFQPSKDIKIRGEFARYSHGQSMQKNGIDFNGTTKLQSAALLADYHLFSNSFRLTFGLDVNTPRSNYVARADGMLVTVNGVPYAVPPGERITADFRYPSTMPYLGLGFGLNDLHQVGFKFGFDVGANFGRASASLDATPGLRAMPGFNSNLASEQAKLNNDANKIRFFPVVKLSAGYAF